MIKFLFLALTAAALLLLLAAAASTTSAEYHHAEADYGVLHQEQEQEQHHGFDGYEAVPSASYEAAEAARQQHQQQQQQQPPQESVKNQQASPPSSTALADPHRKPPPPPPTPLQPVPMKQDGRSRATVTFLPGALDTPTVQLQFAMTTPQQQQQQQQREGGGGGTGGGFAFGGNMNFQFNSVKLAQQARADLARLAPKDYETLKNMKKQLSSGEMVAQLLIEQHKKNGMDVVVDQKQLQEVLEALQQQQQSPTHDDDGGSEHGYDDSEDRSASSALADPNSNEITVHPDDETQEQREAALINGISITYILNPDGSATLDDEDVPKDAIGNRGDDDDDGDSDGGGDAAYVSPTLQELGAIMLGREAVTTTSTTIPSSDQQQQHAADSRLTLEEILKQEPTVEEGVNRRVPESLMSRYSLSEERVNSEKRRQQAEVVRAHQKMKRDTMSAKQHERELKSREEVVAIPSVLDDDEEQSQTQGKKEKSALSTHIYTALCGREFATIIADHAAFLRAKSLAFRSLSECVLHASLAFANSSSSSSPAAGSDAITIFFQNKEWRRSPEEQCLSQSLFEIFSAAYYQQHQHDSSSTDSGGGSSSSSLFTCGNDNNNNNSVTAATLKRAIARSAAAERSMMLWLASSSSSNLKLETRAVFDLVAGIRATLMLASCHDASKPSSPSSSSSSSSSTPFSRAERLREAVALRIAALNMHRLLQKVEARLNNNNNKKNNYEQQQEQELDDGFDVATNRIAIQRLQISEEDMTEHVLHMANVHRFGTGSNIGGGHSSRSSYSSDSLSQQRGGLLASLFDLWLAALDWIMSSRAMMSLSAFDSLRAWLANFQRSLHSFEAVILQPPPSLRQRKVQKHSSSSSGININNDNNNNMKDDASRKLFVAVLHGAESASSSSSSSRNSDFLASLLTSAASATSQIYSPNAAAIAERKYALISLATAHKIFSRSFQTQGYVRVSVAAVPTRVLAPMMHSSRFELPYETMVSIGRVMVKMVRERSQQKRQQSSSSSAFEQLADHILTEKVAASVKDSIKQAQDFFTEWSSSSSQEQQQVEEQDTLIVAAALQCFVEALSLRHAAFGSGSQGAPAALTAAEALFQIGFTIKKFPAAARLYHETFDESEIEVNKNNDNNNDNNKNNRKNNRKKKKKKRARAQRCNPSRPQQLCLNSNSLVALAEQLRRQQNAKQRAADSPSNKNYDAVATRYFYHAARGGHAAATFNLALDIMEAQTETETEAASSSSKFHQSLLSRNNWRFLHTEMRSLGEAVAAPALLDQRLLYRLLVRRAARLGSSHARRALLLRAEEDGGVIASSSSSSSSSSLPQIVPSASGSYRSVMDRIESLAAEQSVFGTPSHRFAATKGSISSSSSSSSRAVADAIIRALVFETDAQRQRIHARSIEIVNNKRRSSSLLFNFIETDKRATLAASAPFGKLFLQRQQQQQQNSASSSNSPKDQQQQQQSHIKRKMTKHGGVKKDANDLERRRLRRKSFSTSSYHTFLSFELISNYAAAAVYEFVVPANWMGGSGLALLQSEMNDININNHNINYQNDNSNDRSPSAEANVESEQQQGRNNEHDVDIVEGEIFVQSAVLSSEHILQQPLLEQLISALDWCCALFSYLISVFNSLLFGDDAEYYSALAASSSSSRSSSSNNNKQGIDIITEIGYPDEAMLSSSVQIATSTGRPVSTHWDSRSFVQLSRWASLSLPSTVAAVGDRNIPASVALNLSSVSSSSSSFPSLRHRVISGVNAHWWRMSPDFDHLASTQRMIWKRPHWVRPALSDNKAAAKELMSSHRERKKRRGGGAGGGGSNVAAIEQLHKEVFNKGQQNHDEQGRRGGGGGGDDDRVLLSQYSQQQKQQDHDSVGLVRRSVGESSNAGNVRKIALNDYFFGPADFHSAEDQPNGHEVFAMSGRFAEVWGTVECRETVEKLLSYVTGKQQQHHRDDHNNNDDENGAAATRRRTGTIAPTKALRFAAMVDVLDVATWALPMGTTRATAYFAASYFLKRHPRQQQQQQQQKRQQGPDAETSLARGFLNHLSNVYSTSLRDSNFGYSVLQPLHDPVRSASTGMSATAPAGSAINFHQYERTWPYLTPLPIKTVFRGSGFAKAAASAAAATDNRKDHQQQQQRSKVAATSKSLAEEISYVERLLRCGGVGQTLDGRLAADADCLGLLAEALFPIQSAHTNWMSQEANVAASSSAPSLSRDGLSSLVPFFAALENVVSSQLDMDSCLQDMLLRPSNQKQRHHSESVSFCPSLNAIPAASAMFRAGLLRVASQSASGHNNNNNNDNNNNDLQLERLKELVDNQLVHASLSLKKSQGGTAAAAAATRKTTAANVALRWFFADSLLAAGYALTQEQLHSARSRIQPFDAWAALPREVFDPALLKESRNSKSRKRKRKISLSSLSSSRKRGSEDDDNKKSNAKRTVGHEDDPSSSSSSDKKEDSLEDNLLRSLGFDDEMMRELHENGEELGIIKRRRLTAAELAALRGGNAPAAAGGEGAAAVARIAVDDDNDDFVHNGFGKIDALDPAQGAGFGGDDGKADVFEIDIKQLQKFINEKSEKKKKEKERGAEKKEEAEQQPEDDSAGNDDRDENNNNNDNNDNDANDEKQLSVAAEEEVHGDEDDLALLDDEAGQQQQQSGSSSSSSDFTDADAEDSSDFDFDNRRYKRKQLLQKLKNHLFDDSSKPPVATLTPYPKLARQVDRALAFQRGSTREVTLAVVSLLRWARFNYLTASVRIAERTRVPPPSAQQTEAAPAAAPSSSSISEEQQKSLSSASLNRIALECLLSAVKRASQTPPLLQQQEEEAESEDPLAVVEREMEQDEISQVRTLLASDILRDVFGETFSMSDARYMATVLESTRKRLSSAHLFRRDKKQKVEKKNKGSARTNNADADDDEEAESAARMRVEDFLKTDASMSFAQRYLDARENLISFAVEIGRHADRFRDE